MLAVQMQAPFPSQLEGRRILWIHNKESPVPENAANSLLQEPDLSFRHTRGYGSQGLRVVACPYFCKRLEDRVWFESSMTGQGFCLKACSAKDEHAEENKDKHASEHMQSALSLFKNSHRELRFRTACLWSLAHLAQYWLGGLEVALQELRQGPYPFVWLEVPRTKPSPY